MLSIVFVYICSGVMWRVALKSSLITVPVTVAVLDIFGYVARVEGASMQVLSVSVECHRSVLAVSAALLITRG